MPPGFGYGAKGVRKMRSAGYSKAKATRLASKRPSTKRTATPRASAMARQRANSRARFKR